MRILLIICSLMFASCNFQQRKELSKTEEHSNIVGKWRVVSSTFLPFEHISYCYKLELNSIFNFDKFGTIKVYEDEDLLKNCNETQSFWIENNKLNIFEYDFVFNYDILMLTSDTLILKTNNAPNYLFSEELFNEPPDSKSNKLIDSIHENGIQIILVKQQSKVNPK